MFGIKDKVDWEKFIVEKFHINKATKVYKYFVLQNRIAGLILSKLYGHV